MLPASAAPPPPPVIYGFLKVRDEALRGNLVQCVRNLQSYCDALFVCDDASTDGTDAALAALGVPDANVLRFSRPDFAAETERKQALLDLIRRRVSEGVARPDWLFWLDGDEVLDASGTVGLRAWIAGLQPNVQGAAFAEVQLWPGPATFQVNQGSHIRLWRYSGHLAFAVERGLHCSQVPAGASAGHRTAPFRILHYATAGLARLALKHARYYGQKNATRMFDWSCVLHVERADPAWFPLGADWRPAPRQAAPAPSEANRARVLSQRNLVKLPQTFGVALPNGADLAARLADLRAQTYEKWVAVAPAGEAAWEASEADVRIFPARYPADMNSGLVRLAQRRAAASMGSWPAEFAAGQRWAPDELARRATALPTSISVCIALKNRWPLFKATLDSLRAWFAADPATELVVADFGSDDCDLATELAASGLRHRVVRLDGYFARAEGLHAAAQAASHELLFFLDADVLVVDPSFGTTLRAQVGVGRAYFPIVYSLNEGRPAAIQGDREDARLANGYWRERGFGMVGITATDYALVGGWNRDMKRWGGEDDDFRWRCGQHRISMGRERCPALIHQWHPTGMDYRERWMDPSAPTVRGAWVPPPSKR